MGHAYGRKDEGTLHIGGSVFLSVFISWLIGIKAQPIAALSRYGLVAATDDAMPTPDKN